MEEFYKEKFKDKSRIELILIIEHASDYNPEAVQAARSLYLLKEKEGERVYTETTKTTNNTFDFIKNYRISYFFNYVILILSLYSLNLFIHFYKEELGLNIQDINVYDFFWVCLLINHLLYIIENKKFYSFFSRCINSIFFFITFISFLKLINSLNHSSIQDGAFKIIVTPSNRT
uniref:hypothetical protein n=1 Tax=Flammeovirga sp. OC4 TaxID=1382345 RepID=UPI0005C6DDF0